MGRTFELLGFGGVAISCFAYVPQIAHLATEHCSAGVSVKAWLLWLLASFLMFLHAISIFDFVFVTLQIANITAITVIIILSKRYQNMYCERHRPAGGLPRVDLPVTISTTAEKTDGQQIQGGSHC